MNTWDQLFLTGEFAPREHILRGLTLEQVGARPAGAPHSIYEELWHADTWQRIVLNGDEQLNARWEQGEQFPTHPAPENEAVWRELVGSFLSGSERAVRFSQDEVWLGTDEMERLPGFTWRNALEHLAVHSAYHLGKIVLLRQLLGVWSPPPDDA